MSKRDWKLFIEDIIESIDKIEKYTEYMDFEIFKTDGKTIDATIRNLEIIGEATRNIPQEVKNKYSYIPWRDILDFRNRITHGYFDISSEIVWRIIKHELPALKLQIKQILEKESE